MKPRMGQTLSAGLKFTDDISRMYRSLGAQDGQTKPSEKEVIIAHKEMKIEGVWMIMS